ncbi:MAG: hypothetical protein JO257_18115 [Deltaproteobacteria bacterium]|nr:hypothetical protein [Deltaproteobacteria bacterium]
MRPTRSLLSVLALAACATAPDPTPRAPGSRGLRASEHIESARDHEEQARQNASYPDTRSDDGTGRADQLLLATPWTRRWDSTEDHLRMAQVHRSAAAQIDEEFEQACDGRAENEITMSPLVKYGFGGSPTEDGVVIYLRPEAGNPDKLMADMRCHRAWMMLQPIATMDMCPLDLEGLSVEARGGKEGVTVTLHVKDRALVPELQKRAAHDLEQGAQLGKMH